MQPWASLPPGQMADSPVGRRAEAETEGADDDGEGGEEAEAAEHQVDGQREEQVHLGTVGAMLQNR